MIEPARRSSQRVPPQDVAAEQSVLGAILLDPEAMPKVVEWLAPDHFYRENHATIYAAMRDLFRRGEPIDNVTLAAELERARVLDRVGGRAQIALLAEEVPTAANIDHYGRIVQAKWRRRRAITIGSEITAAAWDESLDELEVASRAQKLTFGLSEAATHFEPEPLAELLGGFVEGLTMTMENGPAGLKTGFSDLDSKVRLLRPGAMVVICGATGMGKTSLSLNLVLQLLRAGEPVGFFSLEMSKKELVDRLVSMEASVAAERIDQGTITPLEHERIMKAVDRLHGYAPLLIDEQGALTEEQLAAKARLIIPRGVRVIVVDYLQLMKSSRDFRGNRTQEVSYISHELKALAKELQVPVVPLAQLSRAPASRTDKRPQLSDLRESGDIENDADAVIGLYRPDYYDPEERSKRRVTAEVLVMKNRHGSTPTVEMVFDKDQTKFLQVDNRHAAPTSAPPRQRLRQDFDDEE